MGLLLGIYIGCALAITLLAFNDDDEGDDE